MTDNAALKKLSHHLEEKALECTEETITKLRAPGGIDKDVMEQVINGRRESILQGHRDRLAENLADHADKDQ